MRKILAIMVAMFLSFKALAAVTIAESTQVTLLRGTTTLGTFAGWDACRAEALRLANASVATTGVVTYTCQTERRRFVATYSANPPAPTPVNCVVSDWSAWSGGAWSACVNGVQTRTETRTRTIITQPANGGTACPALSEQQVASQSCVAPPPPPPPPPAGDTLAKLLNFAETWDRNWNYGGHTVTSGFTSDYGNWDYTNTTYEPWLFDRATVGYRLFELTGNVRWRDKFISDFMWYQSHIDAQGIFTPKGFDDTKYGYVTPFVLYEKLTGDQQYRPVAKRIYDSWIREWSNDFNPNATMWTEREIAFALEAAVAWYELTNDPAALTRAQALIHQWTVASGSAGAPLVTYTQHEGGGPGGTSPTNLTNSPWMSALYFQAAHRYYKITQDPEVLLQVSRYVDWCENNCYYDAALAHPNLAGMVFPRYLTGELIGDAGYDEGNADHCLDVGGILDFALFAKQQRGESVTALQTRIGQMQACSNHSFENWTRTTDWLPMYRLSPPRKFNWWLRGYYEITQ